MKLWEVDSRIERRSFKGHRECVTSVAFSPDGGRALSGSYDETMKVWDVMTGGELRSFAGHEASVHSVAFSPNGARALSGSADATLKLWEELGSGDKMLELGLDTDPRLEVRTLRGHAAPVLSVAFSPDGTRALSASWDKTLKLWEIPASPPP
jgi:WD40 repeat protein